jgi:hypothetical protein
LAYIIIIMNAGFCQKRRRSTKDSFFYGSNERNFTMLSEMKQQVPSPAESLSITKETYSLNEAVSPFHSGLHKFSFLAAEDEQENFFDAFGEERNRNRNYYQASNSYNINLVTKNLTNHSFQNQEARTITNNSIKSLKIQKFDENFIISNNNICDDFFVCEDKHNKHNDELLSFSNSSIDISSKNNTVESDKLMNRKRKKNDKFKTMKDDVSRCYSKTTVCSVSKGICEKEQNKKKESKSKFACDHDACDLQFKTAKLKLMHHNKLEPECKSDRNGIVKLIAIYKKAILNLAQRLEQTDKLHELKKLYNSIQKNTFDQTFFHMKLGETFEDIPSNDCYEM